MKRWNNLIIINLRPVLDRCDTLHFMPDAGHVSLSKLYPRYLPTSHDTHIEYYVIVHSSIASSFIDFLFGFSTSLSLHSWCSRSQWPASRWRRLRVTSTATTIWRRLPGTLIATPRWRRLLGMPRATTIWRVQRATEKPTSVIPAPAQSCMPSNGAGKTSCCVWSNATRCSILNRSCVKQGVLELTLCVRLQKWIDPNRGPNGIATGYMFRVFYTSAHDVFRYLLYNHVSCTYVYLI